MTARMKLWWINCWSPLFSAFITIPKQSEEFTVEVNKLTNGNIDQAKLSSIQVTTSKKKPLSSCVRGDIELKCDTNFHLVEIVLRWGPTDTTSKITIARAVKPDGSNVKCKIVCGDLEKWASVVSDEVFEFVKLLLENLP